MILSAQNRMQGGTGVCWGCHKHLIVREAENAMTNEEMGREIEALPLEAKRNLQDFLAFLRPR